MSASFSDIPLPVSILDTDLYKLTMQQAVLQQFPNIHCTYRFTNRSISTLFSRQCAERFRTIISYFATITLTEEEGDWLRTNCPYFTPEYLTYLANYRFKPEQVRVKYIPVSANNLQGKVEIDVVGPWVEAILWEVPLMAALSETYFQSVMTDWSYDGQDETAYNKGKTLLEAGCTFSEFGTRRRRSYHTQDVVIQALIRASKEVPSLGALLGTSNVHFAQKYNLTPIGTIAHEWFMGVGALKGYETANNTSLRLWEEVYLGKGTPLIALTDTFSTQTFLDELAQDPERAHNWIGLRQDSGDPLQFAPRVKAMYESIRMDPTSKSLIYSDALNVDKCLQIKKQCDELGFTRVSFGIGTFLTNDFKTKTTGEKSKALNIVIKLSSVDEKPCIKLSDDLTKTTGDKDTVERVKAMKKL